MIYTADDIHFDQINSTDFERLCFELLLKFGFGKLIWRQGGADNGRDIEGSLFFNTPFGSQETRWFFECKHFQDGVPPAQMNSKIAWADAEQPDNLVFFISSYLSNNARSWLESIRAQKAYRITIIEGPELKSELAKFPDLVERFFAVDRYDHLLADTKRHWNTYRITPSYEVLWELTQNLSGKRLTLNELGFLFVSLYKEYRYDFEKDDYFDGLEPKVLAPYYDSLQEKSITGTLEAFRPYVGKYEILTSSGFWDDLEQYVPDCEGETSAPYQYSSLLLHPLNKPEHWKKAHYLFFKIPSGAAFELFCLDDSEFTTACRFYPVISPATIDELCLTLGDDCRSVLKKFALIFQH
jgi:hypothetical protein